MSQNQSYFWQTTKHNVYLKRSARLQMLIALLAVLTFSTICQAEVARKEIDENVATLSAPSAFPDDRQYVKDAMNGNAANDLNEENATKESKSNSGFIDAFSASISVILFTELGDKTFFIAAIMAMRHPRLIVFAGAISALALMTVLSVVFGMAATIIPKIYTYYISTALFAIFGLKMIYEGYFMKDSDAQEELEEVQSTLRKREDELMRKRSKYDDADAKRKNSNSDKEDECLERGAGVTTNNSHDSDSNITTTVIVAHSKNPDMSHRQRKHNNNNNNNNNQKNTNKIGCDVSKDAADSDNSSCHENDIFLNGVNGVSGVGVGVGVAAVDNIHKSTNFHSSPALSASVLSNQTEQTNCDEFTNSPNKLNFKSNNDSGDDDGIDEHNIEIVDGGDDDNATVDSGHGGTPIHGKRAKQTKTGSVKHATAMVHSASASAIVMLHNNNNKHDIITGASNSITSLNSLNLNAKVAVGAGQLNGELKQLGGSKKRLERSASLVQDPESGIVRKNAKKSATHITMRILMQAFTMTFLAEWGDRSQLTTIILAASKNVYGVITGGIIGHSICTGLAVIGGRMVAAKISVRTVTIIGGIVFVGFAVYALIVKPDDI
nr:uncharacterized protein DDB_G0283357 isoform X1 [Bactrocera oleae]XP_014085554.1 uncharacterized protein DDB_G0283357 isoform X1 [Bactrocera oleae]XP_036229138.1 uncharacterized protein DDB_G0283357 isoform X1 [Bactrocera oleae]XP_036229139.1 uncharacterized protein DDB_G0283357 isoform X1 [Bactrocera oleae]